MGYLDDPYKIIAQSKLFVSPQLIGAGIQNKVLQAMALKRPVLGTFKALRAINGERGRHFIQADTPSEMLSASLQVLEDDGLRQKLGHNAAELIGQEYTWEKIGQKLVGLLSGLD